MARWACVDAFRFPLQVVLSLHPDWLDDPVTVVDRSGPRGELLYLNQHARSRGLNRGMSFGEAVGMVPNLHADTVDASELRSRSDELADLLCDFSPRVERDDAHPGLFWLDVSGLESLYERWEQWVEQLRTRLRDDHGIYVAVVIGFSRFATFAIARATGRCGLFKSRHSERRAAGNVALDRLDLDSSTLEATRRLGIETVDELLELPPEGLRRRLGEESFELYRKARGDLQTPRPAARSDDDPSATDRLDHVERNQHRLLFHIKRRLNELVDRLERDGEKVIGLVLTLHRGDDDPVETEIRPASPTRDTGLLADLIRLRLETLPVASGVTDITLVVRGERTTTEQLRLFGDEQRRDIDAANRALARLRAEFGPDSVLCIEPAEGHLPESRFNLERLDKLALPDTTDEPTGRPAIRRFFPTPVRLSGPPMAPCRAGPHLIDGGWWIRQIRRDYRFVGADGRLLWVFYDHHRRCWYLHGEY